MSETKLVVANVDRKIIKPAIRAGGGIPDHILNNIELNDAITALPSNYNFEIHKTIWRIKDLDAKIVGLQMPEGLLIYSNIISNIIQKFTECNQVVIMGDVTYGACCIDDFTARAFKVELLVHYGHSCLIPVDRTSSIKVLYIFVDIKIDPLHFVESIKLNFDISTRIAFVSTVQFIQTLHGVAIMMRKEGWNIVIPQSKPLSAGEILGCTSPRVTDVDILIYLGDGRFHLESAMISNPNIPAYRYDPYDKSFSSEVYDHKEMLKIRSDSVNIAKNAQTFGLILGTLGRQGSPTVLENLKEKIVENGKKYVIILLSEIFPQKLEMFGDTIDVWVQIACPRLSIDWGSAFKKPLLTPYECIIALNKNDSILTSDGVYPMDYYAHNSKGNWTPNHKHCTPNCCK